MSCVACERARPTPPAEPCPPLVDARFEKLGALAALWPQCPVDLPIESYAGRCLHGRHCMQPCRIERIDPAKDAPDDVETLRYDAAGRMVAIRAISALGTLPPLETHCRYAPDGRPLGCGFAPFESTFEYAGDRLAAIHETRDGKPYADEREQWDGDHLIRSTRTDGDGLPEPATRYLYEDGRLVAVRTELPAGEDKIALGYDEQGRVSRIVLAATDVEPSTITLHYDEPGRVRERLEDSKRTTYRYDGDRLVDEDVTYGSLALYRTHYVYDCR